MPRGRKVDMSGPSSQYGEQAAQARNLSVVPAGNADLSAPPVPDGATGALAGMIGPDDVPNLDDDSAYPERPVTFGLPGGPGADGSVNPLLDTDPTRRTLRAMVAAFPSVELSKLLDMMDARGE